MSIFNGTILSYKLRGKYIGCVGKAVSSSYRRQSAQGAGKPHFFKPRDHLWADCRTRLKKSSNPVITSGAKGKKKSGISYYLLFPHPAKSLDKGRLSSAIPTARRRLWTHKKLFRSLGNLDGLRLPNLQENLSWIILGHPSREPVSCGNVFRNDSSIRSQMWRQLICCANLDIHYFLLCWQRKREPALPVT